MEAAAGVGDPVNASGGIPVAPDGEGLAESGPAGVSVDHQGRAKESVPVEDVGPAVDPYCLCPADLCCLVVRLADPDFVAAVVGPETDFYSVVPAALSSGALPPINYVVFYHWKHYFATIACMRQWLRRTFFAASGYFPGCDTLLLFPTALFP